MPSDLFILELIRSSLGYKTTVGPVDKNKVQRALAGFSTTKPSSALGEAAWHLARRAAAGPPPPPPPPPPPEKPTYKMVAPKTANKEGGSDARFCVENQPGVSRMADGTYVDMVARYDSNGLHLGGRSDICTQGQTPGLVGAKSMDGRAPCELTPVGDPKQNTGSWMV
jgi:hypothetical protein